jgi:Zn finger protein HypA/HybF involved in hydrogenase expression
MSEKESNLIPVFEVHLKCSNCGNSWLERFGIGTVVKQEGIFYPKVMVHGPETHSFEAFTSTIHSLKCPVCDAEDITVISRNPIKYEENKPK